jgi:hypothetical protein
VDILIDGPWEGKMISEEGTNQNIWVKRNNTYQKISYNELKNKKYYVGE